MTPAGSFSLLRGTPVGSAHRGLEGPLVRCITHVWKVDFGSWQEAWLVLSAGPGPSCCGLSMRLRVSGLLTVRPASFRAQRQGPPGLLDLKPRIGTVPCPRTLLATASHRAHPDSRGGTTQTRK